MTCTLNQTQTAEKYLADRYEFRKNVITSKTEWRVKGSNEPFIEIGDYFLNSIQRELSNSDVDEKVSLRSLLNSDYVKQVDLFTDYFKSLQPIPGTGFIDGLSNTITTTNQDFWRLCFKKWLVASVACALNPEIVNQQVLVLIGPQGMGKTTWLHKLLPATLKGYMYSGYINPTNKDTLTTIAENMYINLDELGSLRQKDIDSLKELITKPTIQVRRPYAVYAENYIRRASFMASVNHANFLKDDTGTRRFLTFTTTAINYNHRVNMDDVYYEAYQLLQSGFKYWFDGDEIAQIEENNAPYMDISIEYDMVEKHFMPSEEDGQSILATATEITQHLRRVAHLPFSNATVQKVGSALRAMKFKRVKRKSLYMYVIKLTPIEGNDPM